MGSDSRVARDSSNLWNIRVFERVGGDHFREGGSGAPQPHAIFRHSVRIQKKNGRYIFE